MLFPQPVDILHANDIITISSSWQKLVAAKHLAESIKYHIQRELNIPSS